MPIRTALRHPLARTGLTAGSVLIALLTWIDHVDSALAANGAAHEHLIQSSATAAASLAAISSQVGDVDRRLARIEGAVGPIAVQKRSRRNAQVHLEAVGVAQVPPAPSP